MAKLNENFLKMPGSYLFSEVSPPDRRLLRRPPRRQDHPAVHRRRDPPPGPCRHRGHAPGRRPRWAPSRASTATARSRATTSCGRPLPSTTTPPGAWTSSRRRFSSPTAPRATAATSATSSAWTTWWRCATRCTLSMWIPTPWPAGPVTTRRSRAVEQAGLYALRGGERLSPCFPQEKVDIIYLCFPNNPTGAVATREQLKAWVDYANANGSVILYDSAYEAFISEPDVPHSIFEIEGARTCAIEFRSFSKTAGFTGTRCAYTVVPMELERDGAKLNACGTAASAPSSTACPMWSSGAPRPSTPPRAGSRSGQHRLLPQQRQGHPGGPHRCRAPVFGGVNAPYVWLKTSGGMGSWDFFDLLLDRPTWPPPPARASAPAARATSASPPLATPRPPEEAVERIKALR